MDKTQTSSHTKREDGKPVHDGEAVHGFCLSFVYEQSSLNLQTGLNCTGFGVVKVNKEPVRF